MRISPRLAIALPIVAGAVVILALPVLPAMNEKSPEVREESKPPSVDGPNILVTVQIVPAITIPKRYELEQNFPNPSSATTTIGYGCPQESFVSLKVYDIRGRLVANLVSERRGPGIHTAQWDAKNDRGEPVGAGIYLYRLVAGSYVETRRLVILR